MTYDNEAIVRHAYHTAEGSVLDVAGFVAGFAEDGVINLGWSGQGKRPAGQEQVSYRGRARRRSCTQHRRAIPRCPS